MVLIAEPLPEAPTGWLQERCQVVELAEPSCAPGTLPEAASEAQGLVVRTYTHVDADLLGRLPRLRVVGRAGAGLDSIDLEACRARGVGVVYTPEANSSAVAELTWAMVFDAFRPRVFLDAPLEADRWRALRSELLAEREVGGLVFGVYGFGRIGRRVAQAASAFGCRVLASDVVEIPEAERPGVEMVPPDRLMSECDVVSVHVSGVPANRGLIDADKIGRLKPDAVLINTARGHVIDPFALAEFMIEHPRAQAMLDVHDPEPFGADYPLLDIKNVHLAPHIGSATRSAKLRMAWVVRDVHRVLAGEPAEFEA